MTREYDKIEKDAFCDKYEKEIDTGSDGKIDILRHEKEINIIFGSRSNFEEYYSRKQQREYLERNPIQLSLDFEEDENSDLLKMINSLNDKQIKSNPNLVKNKLVDLKKGGFPFEKVGLEKSLYQLSNNEMRSLFYAARKFANDNF